MPRPTRHSPRLRNYEYANAGAYFVTVCTRNRECLFGDVVDEQMRLSRCGRIVDEEWSAIPVHWSGVETDMFVVMPNHVHGIVVLTGAGQAPPLPTVVGSFKSGVSRRAGRVVWQRSFYDRVVRDAAELQALRQYIADNPLKRTVDRENPLRRGRS